MESYAGQNEDKIRVLKNELSQKDKQVEEVKEANRKLYDKLETAERESQARKELLDIKCQQTSELNTQLIESITLLAWFDGQIKIETPFSRTGKLIRENKGLITEELTNNSINIYEYGELKSYLNDVKNCLAMFVNDYEKNYPVLCKSGFEKKYELAKKILCPINEENNKEEKPNNYRIELEE